MSREMLHTMKAFLKELALRIFHSIRWLALVLALLCNSTVVWPQTYPARPIKLVVPFGPGASDVAARLLADGLRDQLGVPIVIENRPGANGNLGTQQVAHSPADGYTILFVSTSLVTSPSLYINPGYDALRDFAAVAQIGSIPLVMTVPADLKIGNISDFIQYAKTRQFNYGSAGVGNVTHLVAAAFFDAIDAKPVHVPYRGTAPIADLMTGRLQFYAGSPTSILPVVRDGRVVPLAVTTRARVPLMPDVPALGESVLPGFDYGVWYGILAPAATPAAVVKTLSDAINRIVDNPDNRKKFEAQGYVLGYSGPAEFNAHIRSELANWTKVIKASGVKPE